MATSRDADDIHLILINLDVHILDFEFLKLSVKQKIFAPVFITRFTVSMLPLIFGATTFD